MPESVKFDTELVKAAWRTVADGATDAIKDPSAIASFSKEVIALGATAVKFLGIAENANDIRKLWRDEEEKKKHSLLGRIGLTIIYAGNIAASSIAAAAVFGASVVAAPFATLIVSGAGLVKNIADYTKENTYLKKLNAQAKDLETELAKANIAFEVNTGLYHDLQSAKDNIAQLESEKLALADEIHNLQTLEATEELPEQDVLVANYLAEEANEIADELAQKGFKNELLAKNYTSGKHKDETSTQNLQRIEEKQKLYSIAKDQLLEEMKTANPKDKAELEQKLKIVDAKITKYGILKPHYEKIQKLEGLLQEVQKQQANLDTKYSTEPYQNGTVDKNLEAEYLSIRAEELTAAIAKKMDPEKRNEKASINKEAADKVSAKGQNPTERMSHIRETLIEKLTQQKEKVDSKIKAQEKTLDNKQKYASLFTKDPKQAMLGDAKGVYEKSLALLDKRNEIKLTQMDRTKKGKGIGFAAAGLGIATCICLPPLWPVAGILAIVGAGVGAVWGISSLWDKYQKSKAEKAIKQEKGPEAIKLLSQIDTHMQKKVDKDNAKKAEVTQDLVSRLNDTQSKLATSEVAHDGHVAQSSNGVLNHHKEDRRKMEEAVAASAATAAIESPAVKTTVKSKSK